MNLYPLFKFLAFKGDPESIHEKSMEYFQKYPNLANFFPQVNSNRKYQISDGHMQWDFPVGLAAGFDKNAQAINYFSKVGFGALELGTATLLPQVGNPRPRIWRYPKINSIRNAMGFPNLGSDEILKNIQNATTNKCIGVNLGKNKNTNSKDTPFEYAKLYKTFASDADYLVINISSPNTPGLRDLQTKEAFKEICIAVDEERIKNPKPLYLKISPDLAEAGIYDMVDLAKEFKLSGIIATNTTVQHDYGSGGLSGNYIKSISKNIRKLVCEAAKENPELSVIGVGGIDSFGEILDFWKQGGSLVQIYSSFIFQGPKVLTNIQRDIDNLLKETQYDSLQTWLDDFRRMN